MHFLFESPYLLLYHLCRFRYIYIENNTNIIASIFWLLSDDVIVLKFEAFVDLLNTLSLLTTKK